MCDEPWPFILKGSLSYGSALSYNQLTNGNKVNWTGRDAPPTTLLYRPRKSKTLANLQRQYSRLIRQLPKVQTFCWRSYFAVADRPASRLDTGANPFQSNNPVSAMPLARTNNRALGCHSRSPMASRRGHQPVRHYARIMTSSHPRALLVLKGSLL